jgi:hypothetical protein
LVDIPEPRSRRGKKERARQEQSMGRFVEKASASEAGVRCHCVGPKITWLKSRCTRLRFKIGWSLITPASEANLGDSRQILSEAIAKLKTLGGVKVSKLYQSPPMGPQDQPNLYKQIQI